jgi:hypothetical protein
LDFWNFPNCDFLEIGGFKLGLQGVLVGAKKIGCRLEKLGGERPALRAAAKPGGGIGAVRFWER